ncbi:MAG: competence/damage-inducible protein A [Myxococcota bacterium]|nr:competence/damage-inducible protein A [Myxococcota bacterium]
MNEAIIISQGNELTTGQTVDTNAHWLCGKLWEMGLTVRRVITVPDRLDDLVEVIQAAMQANVVVGTGGLGPTRDDLTAEAVAQALGVPLELNTEALTQVEARFRHWGRTMAESNRKQALVPTGSTILENRWGTAPGFSVNVGTTRAFFLPGVPREMRPMFETHVEPDLVQRLQLPPAVTHTIRVVGIAESDLEERLRGVESPGVTIGFRAHLPENQVKLRFDPDLSTSQREEILSDAMTRIGSRALGVDTGDLAVVVGETLAQREETLALAESCTGGQLAAWIAGVPGASRYLLEGAVVYSNAAKQRMCGVQEQVLREHGAVSEAVARALAEGIRAHAHSTWGIGITGIAGPGGGTADKPVGTVHIAVSDSRQTSHRMFRLPGDRSRITSLSAAAALGLLRKRLNSPE